MASISRLTRSRQQTSCLQTFRTPSMKCCKTFRPIQSWRIAQLIPQWWANLACYTHALSHTHPLILYAFTPSHPHTLTTSYSPPHTSSHSPSHTLTLIHSPSPPHTLTLTSSHPHLSHILSVLTSFPPHTFATSLPPTVSLPSPRSPVPLPPRPTGGECAHELSKGRIWLPDCGRSRHRVLCTSGKSTSR